MISPSPQREVDLRRSAGAGEYRDDFPYLLQRTRPVDLHRSHWVVGEYRDDSPQFLQRPADRRAPADRGVTYRDDFPQPLQRERPADRG